MAKDDPIVTWNEFSSAITGLNAREAFSVALAVEKKVYCVHYMKFPLTYQPLQALPELLFNYACAQGDVDNAKDADYKKVDSVTRLILGTRFRHANDYAVKLQGRVEFQSPDILAEMPKDIVSIYDAAVTDARNGDAQGFAWACFNLKQVFAKPSAGPFSMDEAFDLHEALETVPGVVVDAYGDAGLDVAAQMEKMLGKINVMPVRPM